MEALKEQVAKAGRLDAKAKHLIGVAVAHLKRCPDCIGVHRSGAAREGATEEEIREAIRIGRELDGAAHGSGWPLEPADDPWVELDHYE
ncbi:MAG TPA: carboxymuconolactone decarboxylase family protein [Candidatus Polarisedimenticolaceae bacterium]|nr:carboxymuconolactone decarboxylase family protein [Candidatus Polarisedimenticolaceae bacterium]